MDLSAAGECLHRTWVWDVDGFPEFDWARSLCLNAHLHCRTRLSHVPDHFAHGELPTDPDGAGGLDRRLRAVGVRPTEGEGRSLGCDQGQFQHVFRITERIPGFQYYALESGGG